MLRRATKSLKADLVQATDSRGRSWDTVSG